MSGLMGVFKLYTNKMLNIWNFTSSGSDEGTIPLEIYQNLVYYYSNDGDIIIQGQLEPIYLYENKILDGRNIYKAFIELEKTPIYQ